MTRRHFLSFLLSTVASFVLGQRAGAGPSDQGIGGTGLKPPTADESDRGLGGTGVIGTIRKFGSIVVNDLRIAYPEDAQVRIDGRPAAIADLKIGQVVRVAASGKDDALSTKTIDVTHEVVGPVEHVGDKGLTVLGQTVSTEELERSGTKLAEVKSGDVVSVSGLRRNDGTIVASLVEPSPGARSRIAGPLRKDDDGTLKIGDREVVAVDPHLAGQRVVLEGVQSKVHFVAVTTTAEKGLLPRSVRKLSIESYVERHGDSLRSGSGYAFEGGHFDVPAGRSIRAVLQTNVDAEGRLTVDSFRAGGRTYFGAGGRGPGGHGPGGRGPGGRGPGGRGPGGRGPGGHEPGGRGPGGRGPGGGRGAGRDFGGRGGFGDREFGGGRGFGRRGRGGGHRGGRGAGWEGGGDRRPMDFGREQGGPFEGGRGGGGFAGGGGGGGFAGGPGGGGFGGPGGGGFGGPGGGGGFGGPGGGGFGGGPGGGGFGGGPGGGGGGRH